MKNILFIILLFSVNFAISQTNFSKVKVETKEEVKAAEPEILEASNYILTHK